MPVYWCRFARHLLAALSTEELTRQQILRARGGLFSALWVGLVGANVLHPVIQFPAHDGGNFARCSNILENIDPRISLIMEDGLER